MADYNPEEIESEVKKFWEQNSVKEKVRNSTEGNEKFFMIDGPPYLNGEPHVGHMQGKVLKDVMLRFKQMQGYDVWDQAGFDTHGLPNELATEEELGIEDKNEIGDEISSSKFIKECRNRATSAGEIWKDVMGDLAVWLDFENPYMTYDNDYIESAWWLLSQTEDQDLLYKGYKPIHWCSRCQTSLSGYEVTDEYQEIEDYAVYVKFPLENRDENLVIWTTTPWTIPSNMAVFTHPDYRYAVVDHEGEKLIIAEQLVGEVMGRKGADEEDYSIERTLAGSDLKGMKYRTPFIDEIPRQRELDDEQGVHRVHNSEELVTLEEGTGLVHAATGHGPEDYDETRSLGLPVYSPLDEEGNYTEQAGELEGLNVLEVDPEIIDRLEQKGLMLHSESYVHEYPHCWRCENELIYRAAEQWFIKNEEVKQRMLDENEDVDWVPESTQKRFHNFAEESPDWCITRQNYWGIPVPIWVNDKTGDYEVIGSFEELERKAGDLPEDFDPHKHVVDDITWEGEEGGTYRRIPDIFDVWFDSGCAPFASLHYPFEEQPFEDLWPVDFITEASDQIRGWFYHLLFCGILGFDEKPYEKILFQGYVLRADGEKMSKSSGTTINPQSQIEKYGADIPRFYQLRLAPPWEQKNYDETEIQNEIYRLFSVFWNTKEFLNTYRDEKIERPDELELEDQWIISRLNSLIENADNEMENCTFHSLTRDIERFILHDLSRWYVKIVRSRVKNGDRSAIWTLQQVLRRVSVLMAPFSPFVTEKIYRELDGEKESVHLEEYPEADEPMIDKELESQMETVREIVEKSTKIRDENQYNLRWPSKRIVVSTDQETEQSLERFSPLIKDMANIKSLEFGDVASRLQAEPDYSSLGPKYGENADEVAKLVEELDHDQVEKLDEVGELEIESYQIERDDIEISTETRENVGGKSFESGEIYLDLEMDNELEREALVLETIRSVQQKRKDEGLEVEDRVKISFSGDIETVKEFEQTIRERVNITEVNYDGEDLDFDGSTEFRGRNVKFSFSDPVGE